MNLIQAAAEATGGDWRLDAGEGLRILSSDPRATIIAEHPGSPSNPQVLADAVLCASAPKTLDLLQEARLQLQYLSEKFGQTGSGNTILARIDAHLEANHVVMTSA